VRISRSACTQFWISRPGILAATKINLFRALLNRCMQPLQVRVHRSGRRVLLIQSFHDDNLPWPRPVITPLTTMLVPRRLFEVAQCSTNGVGVGGFGTVSGEGLRLQREHSPEAFRKSNPDPMASWLASARNQTDGHKQITTRRLLHLKSLGLPVLPRFPPNQSCWTGHLRKGTSFKRHSGMLNWRNQRRLGTCMGFRFVASMSAPCAAMPVKTWELTGMGGQPTISAGQGRALS
jgi:hypothetical protein